jgi:chromosome partitioning protein
MKIISIINQKGGVGKTTTAHNVGVGLALRGRKVLFIDADAQRNLTRTIGAIPAESDIRAILLKRAKIDDAIQRADGGDIIPASPELADADIDIKGVGKEHRLKESIKGMKSKYDYIIIDTPPRVDIVTVNALAASHGCIIPSQADVYSLQGIGDLYKTVAEIREYCGNPSLDIMGILLTRYNGRTVLGREIAEGLKTTAKKIGTKLFKSAIRECNAVKGAQAKRQSIFDYAPDCTAAQDYNDFVNELLKEPAAKKLIKKSKGGERG